MNRTTSILLAALVATAVGFAPAPLAPRPPSALDAKGGRGGLDVSGGSKLGGPRSIGGSDPSGSDSSAPKGNWIQTSIPSISSLPKERGEVKLVDTNVPALIDRATNPTGAVSIVNTSDKTYCFSSSCASCKIPLAKAKVLDPNDETGDDPRLQCDFCGATYNVRTGRPVKKEGGKLFGFLFSKSENVPLPTYGLGERGGKVFINLP